MHNWRSRDATRQARRREINESIEEYVRRGAPQERWGAYVCECGDHACTQTVSLSLTEYETVRACPNHFLIVTNHENPEVESVVTESKRFAIVETFFGEASKIALRTDPRGNLSGLAHG